MELAEINPRARSLQLNEVETWILRVYVICHLPHLFSDFSVFVVIHFSVFVVIILEILDSDNSHARLDFAVACSRRTDTDQARLPSLVGFFLMPLMVLFGRFLMLLMVLFGR